MTPLETARSEWLQPVFRDRMNAVTTNSSNQGVLGAVKALQSRGIACLLQPIAREQAGEPLFSILAEDFPYLALFHFLASGAASARR